MPIVLKAPSLVVPLVPWASGSGSDICHRGSIDLGVPALALTSAFQRAPECILAALAEPFSCTGGSGQKRGTGGCVCLWGGGTHPPATPLPGLELCCAQGRQAGRPSRYGGPRECADCRLPWGTRNKSHRGVCAGVEGPPASPSRGGCPIFCVPAARLSQSPCPRVFLHPCPAAVITKPLAAGVHSGAALLPGEGVSGT